MATMDSIERVVLEDGRVQLRGGRCTFTYERARAGLMVIAIEGSDRGQFGTTTLDEIRFELLRHKPLELFIDAAQAQFVSVEVSRDWTQFFSQHQPDLTRVSVLVGSRAVELTVAIAQHLSRTGPLIQIYTDRTLFDARLEASRQARRV